MSMKRYVAIFVLTVVPCAVFAMTYYLDSEWVEKGNRFCKYGNGTVLNVGYKTCPLSIQG